MFLNKNLSAIYRQFIGNLFHQGKIVCRILQNLMIYSVKTVSSYFSGANPRNAYRYFKVYKKFGFKAKTSFEEGLRKTIEWYEEILE